ncbi:MAG: hypothetical protein COA79_21110, partial [Planctomycetota bacterium]
MLPNGSTYEFTYDASSSSNTNSLSQIEFTPNGTSSVTLKNTYEFNADGTLASESKDVNGANSTKSYTYENGQVKTSTNELGQVITNTYNGTPSMLTGESIARDDMTIDVTYEYNSSGLLEKKTDGRGNFFTNQYNASGQLTIFTNKMGKQTVYEYDDFGNKNKETLPNGDVTSFIYNDNNRLTNITFPDLTTEVYAYDGNGSLEFFTNRSGNVTQYLYDDLNRLTSVNGVSDLPTLGGEGGDFVYKSGHSYTYNPSNHIETETNPDGIVNSFVYNTTGQLIEEHLDLNGDDITELSEYDASMYLVKKTRSTGEVIEYVNNALGLVLKETSYDGATVVYVKDYTYDAQGNMLSQDDNDGDVQTFARNNEGFVTEKIEATGLKSTFNYDEENNISSYINISSDGTVSFTSTSEFDGNNKLTKTTDANGLVETFEYNDLGQMVKTTNKIGNSEEMTYDFQGKVTDKTIGADVYAHVYNNNGQVISSSKNGIVEVYNTYG